MAQTRTWKVFLSLLAVTFRFSFGFHSNPFSSRVRSTCHSRRRVTVTLRAREKSDHENESDGVESTSSLCNSLMQRFQGDFDNYNQVLKDRQEGLLPREGGGHEHIHCCLIPVTDKTRLAAFYFDGKPGAIFRFRFYELKPTVDDENNRVVDMFLHTLHPSMEGQLRQHSDPLQWPAIFNKFEEKDRIKLLPNCEVRWSLELDPVQHKYARQKPDDAIHAVMVHGEAVVDSQMMPGEEILIRDQLSLWSDEFWIHDRGYNPSTMEFIYGNQKGIPYQLERVTRISCDDTEAAEEQGATSYDRDVVNSTLAWTLGPDYRTEVEYKDKLAAVGGVSVPKR